MKDEYQIQQAGEQDLGIVSVLFDRYRVFYGQESDTASARRFLAERMSGKESVIFLLKDGSGNGIGFVQLYPSFSSVFMQRMWILNDLYVLESHRRSGAGTMLMDKAKQFARDTRARGLTLATAASNVAAQRLYEAAGFAKNDGFYYYTIIV